MDLVSIIVPSFRSEPTIRGCLSSLLGQKARASFEVILVDSSPGGIPDSIGAEFPSVRFIQLPARVHAGRARNVGMEKARGDILAFIDADCTAAAGWLSGLAARHQQGHRAVGGSIANGSPDNLCSRAEYPLELIEFSPGNPAGPVPFISAANSSFRREILDRVGGFPDIRAGEDVVLCHRLRQNGVPIFFDPDIEVEHKNEVTLRGYLKKQKRHGLHSFRIRQMEKLSGSFINNRVLFPLLFPGLPVIRAARILMRSLSLKNGLALEILKTAPLFMAGCVMWSLGYGLGYLRSLGSRNPRSRISRPEDTE